ncbi:hypothetical protein DFH27DRAFT_561593, partial [Peziza echinospora]
MPCLISCKLYMLFVCCMLTLTFLCNAPVSSLFFSLSIVRYHHHLFFFFSPKIPTRAFPIFYLSIFFYHLLYLYGCMYVCLPL